VPGTGSGSVLVGANPNFGPDRTGTIIVSFTGGQIALTVFQPGFNFTLGDQ
jgi:hypothetical protein